ncbi:hypothetical protein Ae201684P_018570 [Aphanomyces euteiches]|nr:hypothetical protein Ae201684P_018570 [Aphanomyces euteiches]
MREAPLPRNQELMAAMTDYSLGNYVREILHVMMERVVVAQPNDPLEFLIQVVKTDQRIAELDDASRFSRMDLRTVATKTKHLRAIFQEIQGKDGTTNLSRDSIVDRLLASKLLHKSFPRHAQEIVQAFGNKETAPAIVSSSGFVTTCLAVLSKRVL